MEVSVCFLEYGWVRSVLSMAGDDLVYVMKSLFRMPEPLIVAQDAYITLWSQFPCKVPLQPYFIAKARTARALLLTGPQFHTWGPGTRCFTLLRQSQHQGTDRTKPLNYETFPHEYRLKWNIFNVF